MENQNIILMADIIGSGKAKDQNLLMRDFKSVISAINGKMSGLFLSPMTITLGDEFQSVLVNLGAATQTICSVEEEIVHQGKAFKLRYILLEGAIETPINNEIAYEMMGPGLTKSRNLLNGVKNEKRRFYIDVADREAGKALNNSFLILQTIVDSWRLVKDYQLVSKFLEHFDYKVVAEKTGKTRSQMWKRRKSLMIEEYLAVKSLIRYIGGVR